MSIFERFTQNISKVNTTGTRFGFSNAITVWINKPHVVNRRQCGASIHYYAVIPAKCLCFAKLQTILSKTGYEFVQNLTQLEKPSVEKTEEIIEEFVPTEIEGLPELRDKEVAVIIRELIQKQPKKHPSCFEIIIYEKASESVCFIPIKKQSSEAAGIDENQVDVIYMFQYSEHESKAEVILSASSADYNCDSARTLSLTWLKNQLLKKITNWSEQPSLKTSLTSLTLLCLEEYNSLYSELKNKYGLHFAKIWPESTDPQKFVFEDVAIATYLLLLWKQDRERKELTEKQSFVDLGCGNGLLVHILTSEGHQGYGLDIRKRKIWDLYEKNTDLREQAVIPSGESTFPDYDWLIGNHSDELTPWIPVMAARSSYDCCFLLLPCCHWDFDSKFSEYSNFKKGQSCGQYSSYLNFVRTVGETCGFNMEEDVLRIPSTKRVCFIGRTRNYVASEEAKIDEQREHFISSRCRQSSKSVSTTLSENSPASDNTNSTQNWAADFVPRAKTEVVRNCVAIPEEIKDTVVRTVFERILQQSDGEVGTTHDGKVWRKGGTILVGDVVTLFDKNLLASLKAEFGGLKTLLKNYNHVFQVCAGNVKLRDFTLEDPFDGQKDRGKSRDRSSFLKTTLCWFHDNHPDGCPRQPDKCRFAHGVTELCEKPTKKRENGKRKASLMIEHMT